MDAQPSEHSAYLIQGVLYNAVNRAPKKSVLSETRVIGGLQHFKPENDLSMSGKI